MTNEVSNGGFLLQKAPLKEQNIRGMEELSVQTAAGLLSALPYGACVCARAAHRAVDLGGA